MQKSFQWVFRSEILLLYHLNLKRIWPSQENLARDEAFRFLNPTPLAGLPYLDFGWFAVDVQETFSIVPELQVGKVEVQHKQKERRGEQMIVKHPVSRELVTRCSQELSAVFS